MAIIAIAVSGVACRGEAEQERTAISELAKLANKPASSGADRLEAVGRGATKTKTVALPGGAVYTGQPGTSAAPGGEDQRHGTEPDRGALTVIGRHNEHDEEAQSQMTIEQRRVARQERREDERPGASAGVEVARVPGKLRRKQGGVGNACLKHRSVARPLGFGFDHQVHLENRCSHRVVCTVTTDINPEPLVEEVEPNQTRVVLTFRGSPSRHFRAEVDCRASNREPSQWIGPSKRGEHRR